MPLIFRKWPIRYQLMLWFSLVVVLAIASAGWVIKLLIEDTVESAVSEELAASTRVISTMVETALDVGVRNHLRGIAKKNVTILQQLVQDVRKGLRTESEAKKLAEEILLSQPIGETGYIYALTSHGIVDVHPNEKMKHRDMSDHWLAKRQIEKKEGYLEYEWKNPGETIARPKALYMAYFEPWDWIISVSSYRSEFPFLFEISDLQSSLKSFHFGTTGYAFILDENGKLLVSTDVAAEKDFFEHTHCKEEFFKEMQTRESGQLFYQCKTSGSKRSRKKLISFHHIPRLKCVVASSVFIDEMRGPLLKLEKIIITTIIVILLLILLISLYLGAAITRPLTRLTKDMGSVSSGDFDITLDEEAHGEIGDLARHFNEFMNSLQVAHAQLNDEIGERIQAESQLKLFGKVFESALEGIYITDANGTIIAVNQSFINITGFGRDEVIGKNPRILKSDKHDAKFYQDMWQSLSSYGQWSGEIWNRKKTGEAYPEFLSISAVYDNEDTISHYAAVFHDISERKSQEEQIKHQAYHDALTGLPNRLLARDRLSVAIKHANRYNSRIAVFFLDLDNFKNINDSLGHATGDIVLQNVGKRLRHLVRDEDTVARLGGDEFLIIASSVQSEREGIELAGRLLDGFKDSISLTNYEFFATVSIGIAFYPEDGLDEGSLTKNADVAMYQAKSEGKNKYHLFTTNLSERASYRMQLEGELRQALKRKEFTVYFQPKVDAETNSVTGVEALVRWAKEDGSIVSPADFIPLAEETGLIVPLGQFVLEESCRAISVLDRAYHSNISVAVNLSPLQFQQSTLVESILDILQTHAIPTSRLELEITESTMMTNPADCVKKLDMLRNSGISIAIDDFGTGYSSLYYLKTFPISTLKIDRSFIRDITFDENDAQIVETIVLMAKKLGIGIVAEGVETVEQLELLSGFGCMVIQGFYFSKPLPLDELIVYLDSN